MQHMPDKEFDKLFKDRFEDAEIEPSTNLWANIEKELEPVKKRTLPIYWMAAAVVALAFSAMLVFQKKEVLKLHGDDQTAINKPAVVDTVATPEQSPISVEPVQKQLAKNPIVRAQKQAKEEIVPAIHTIDQTEQKIQLAVQPNTTNDRLPIKQQDPKPINVVPIKEVPVENPEMIANNVKPTNTIETKTITETETTERKGIRNVGDLVNYVVDKVDKRDKKLVRFNTDDDDNSSIVGINIGFLKFNKRNKDR